MTSAIILAGGLGTRLRSAVPDTPKPMAPINGKPFLEHQMLYWISQGINHFVLSVGYKYQTIINYFGLRFEGVTVEYSIEHTQLGTGGGLLLAAERVSKKEKFLLLNGDTYFKVNLNDLMNFSFKNEADWTFSLFQTGIDDRYMGIKISTEGKIEKLKSKFNSKNVLANGGVYLVNPEILFEFPFKSTTEVSLEEDLLPVGLAKGQKFFGKEYSELFIDIGLPSEYLKAQKLFKNKI